MMSERHTGEARRSFPVHQYNLPSIPIIYIPNPFYQMTVQRASRTEHPKQPPCLVRDAISDTLHELPGKTAIHQKSQIHQSVQTFNSPPVPMLLSKHKVQFIQNTQQTVIYSTNSNALSAIPLQLLQNHTECRSSVFIILKSKTYQINV